MSNARTTSLHERLSTELRRAVERDLIEQPPGRETYAKVFEFHNLGEHGISLTSLERYGMYLRRLARNEAIRSFADGVIGREADPVIAGGIKARLVEVVESAENPTPGELLKAAVAFKALRDSDRADDAAMRAQAAEERAAAKFEAEMAEKDRKRKTAEAEADALAAKDPAAALAKFREDVKAIYGLN